MNIAEVNGIQPPAVSYTETSYTKVIPPSATRKVISKSQKIRHGLKMEQVVYHFKKGRVTHSITRHEPQRQK